MSRPTEADFITMVGQMFEYLTPKMLAKDLGVSKSQVIDWRAGNNLPTGEELSRHYMAMMTHSVWEG